MLIIKLGVTLDTHFTNGISLIQAAINLNDESCI